MTNDEIPEGAPGHREIEVTSTSRNSAECSPIVLRETSLTRVVFEPDLVNNHTNPAASVRGHLVFQKKAKADSWTNPDLERIQIKNLKVGQWLRVEVGANALKAFYDAATALYDLHGTQGIPSGERTFVEAPKALANIIASLEQLDIEALENLTSLAGLSALRRLLAVWEANQKNSSEAFWQATLEENAFLLSTLFAHPVVFFDGKSYAGGKRYTDHGGNYPDFLLRSELTRNAAIIEIKTPLSQLLRSTPYREGVFAPDVELAGAVVQVLTAKDSLTEERARLFDRDDPELRAWNPECFVIIGNTNTLDSMERRRSFELYRREHLGVCLVTFDELFTRIQRFIELLQERPDDLNEF